MRFLLPLVFMLAAMLHAQLPANLDCKCTATGNGEYLCRCVTEKAGTAASAPAAAATKTATPATSAAALPTDTAKTQATSTANAAATPTPKAGETPTGTTTAKGQEIYTGPRGGQYHYSSSGKKVYTRKN